MHRESYCTTIDVGVDCDSISKMLKFSCLSFYVMGKELTGELSCMWTGLVLVILLQYGGNKVTSASDKKV